MKRKAIVCSVVVILALILVSCAKLPDSPPNIEGRLKMEIGQCGSTIPSTWGNLVSVSSVSQYPGWVQMWFQDGDGNVYMIPYQVESNTFHENYRFLRRQ